MSKNAKMFLLICAVLGVLSGRIVDILVLSALYFGGFFFLAMVKAVANYEKPEQPVTEK